MREKRLRVTSPSKEVFFSYTETVAHATALEQEMLEGSILQVGNKAYL